MMIPNIVFNDSTQGVFNEILNIVLRTIHKGVEVLEKILDALSYYSCKILTVEEFMKSLIMINYYHYM